MTQDFYSNQMTEEELKEFKQIYLEDYGKALTDLEATDLAGKLMLLFSTLYRKVPVDH